MSSTARTDHLCLTSLTPGFVIIHFMYMNSCLVYTTMIFTLCEYHSPYFPTFVPTLSCVPSFNYSLLPSLLFYCISVPNESIISSDEDMPPAKSSPRPHSSSLPKRYPQRVLLAVHPKNSFISRKRSSASTDPSALSCAISPQFKTCKPRSAISN